MPLAELILKIRAEGKELATSKIKETQKSWDSFSRTTEQRGRKINEWLKAHKAAALAIVGAIAGVMYKIQKYSPSLQYFTGQLEIAFMRLAIALDPGIKLATDAAADALNSLVGGLEEQGETIQTGIGTMLTLGGGPAGLLALTGNWYAAGVALMGALLLGLEEGQKEEQGKIGEVGIRLKDLVMNPLKAGADTAAELLGVKEGAASGWNWSGWGKVIGKMFWDAFLDAQLWGTGAAGAGGGSGPDIPIEWHWGDKGAIPTMFNSGLNLVYEQAEGIPSRFNALLALGWSWATGQELPKRFQAVLEVEPTLTRDMPKEYRQQVVEDTSMTPQPSQAVIQNLQNTDRTLKSLEQLVPETWQKFENFQNTWEGFLSNMGRGSVAIPKFAQLPSHAMGHLESMILSEYRGGAGMEDLADVIAPRISKSLRDAITARTGWSASKFVTEYAWYLDAIGKMGQTGIPHVSKEGWYYLHRDEEVKPAALSRSGGASSYITELSQSNTFHITASPDTDVSRLKRELENSVKKQLTEFERTMQAQAYSEYSRRRT